MKRVGQLYRDNLREHIKQGVEKNTGIFLFSYSRVSSPQITNLRKSLRQTGARMFVSKNSLAQKALKELKQEELAQKINGQTAFIWGGSDSVEVSKILVKFAKDFEYVVLQGGMLEGRLLKKEDIKKLSDLPSRQVLLAMLLGSLQAPLSRLAGALNAKTRDLLSLLKQLSEKKGGN